MGALKESPKQQLITACLEPVGRRIEIEPGLTLLWAIQSAGIQVAAVCGGEGICGKCLVRLLEGELSPVSAAERELLSSADLRRGYRLACRAHPTSDVTIYIPPEVLTTEQRLQTEGRESELDLDPVVKLSEVSVEKPDIKDLRSDATRLLDACSEAGLGELAVEMPLLGSVSEVLRDEDWVCRVASNGEEIVAVLPASSPYAGLAVDIGTTKIAAYLIDLDSGEILGKTGRVNPQVGYGDDVINRIAFANRESDGRKILQTRLTETLNEMVEELCRPARIDQGAILEAVVVGNTVMHHLFAGLPVRQLGEAPYVPAVSESMRIRSNDIGLKLAPGSYTYLPPNVAGYVGADHISMLLATDVWRRPDTVLAIDIGTNTEVSLVSKGRLLSCSCASGPAFEGAHIKFGMRAVRGAIERVEIHERKIFTQTIDDQPPVGICGSGILDAIAQMHLANVIDDSGRLDQNHPGVRQDRHGGLFTLVPSERSGSGREISLSRKDVNEIQLAKAAIRTGIEILLREAGISADEISEFVIAGAFGTYLSVDSATQIGMFPDLPSDRFHQVGNAAGIGARQMLLSKKARFEAENLREQIEYIELTVHPDFFDVYATELMF